MNGLGSFVSQPFQDDPPIVLDGITINCRVPITKNRTTGANLLGMADGSTVVQIDWRDAPLPEKVRFYEFSFAQMAVAEEAWWKLDELDGLGRPFVLIDFDYETATFSAGPELTTFKLPRATAASLWAGFPTSYPPFITLNGDAQTVIDTGTPSTGEVKLVGSVVTTPGLANGDILKVLYVPAYYVVVKSESQANSGGGKVDRTWTLTEARSFS